METANIITINTEDKNLAEIIKKIIADAGLSVGDLFEDDEVCDHIHEAGISADVVYDEDDILACGCVTDKIEELEQRLLEKVKIRTAEYEEKMKGLFKEGLAELKAKVAELKKENAELERKLAVSNEALVCLGYRVDDEPCEVVSEEE
jgi:hypothetical protein